MNQRKCTAILQSFLKSVYFITVSKDWKDSGQNNSYSLWTVLSYKGHHLIGRLFMLWEAWLVNRKCVQYSPILKTTWEVSLLQKTKWRLQAIYTSVPHKTFSLWLKNRVVLLVLHGGWWRSRAARWLNYFVIHLSHTLTYSPHYEN